MSIKELEAKINKNSLTLCIGFGIGFGLITISLFVIIGVFSSRIDSMGEKLNSISEYKEQTIDVCSEEGCSYALNIGKNYGWELVSGGYKLTTTEAIRIMMDHMGVEFKYIPSKPSNVVVSKKGAE